MKIQVKTEIKLQTFSAIFIKIVKSIVILHNIKGFFRSVFTKNELLFLERKIIFVKMMKKAALYFNSLLKLFFALFY